MAFAPALKKAADQSSAAKPPAAKPRGAAAAGMPLYVQAWAAMRGVPSTFDAGGGADLGGASVVDSAAAGVASADAPLPHHERIQAAFGAHDVGHVRAAVGGEGGATAEQLGARAYTVGDRVAFREAPDVRLAAHEAAHVVQQRAGVQLAGGVGRAGDPHERQADAVADAVVDGRSAEAILGPTRSPGGTPGGGVQMACSCGGTCGSCSAGAAMPADPRQVQFELEAGMERELEPMVDPRDAGEPEAGGEQPAPKAGGAEAPASDGGGGKAGGTQGCAKDKPAEAPSPEDAALDAVSTRAGNKACPPEADPPNAEQHEAGEDEGDCSDYGAWDAADPKDEYKDDANKGEAKPPPEPDPAPIRTQPKGDGEKLADAKPEVDSKDTEKPKPPPGCEEANKDDCSKAGKDAGGGEPAGEASGGGAGAGAGAGEEEPQQNPMEAAVAEAMARRESGRAAYGDGVSQLGAARAQVRGANRGRVRFASVAGSESAAGASAVATRGFGEMTGDATALADDVGANVPERVGESFHGVRDSILAARDRSLQTIDAELTTAKHAASARAARAASMIRSQYLQTVVTQTAAAALGVANIIAATSRTLKGITQAQATQMGALTTVISEGQDKLIKAGTTQGNVAMGIGRAYYRMYEKGKINRRDSIMKGHLTDRRAAARSKAAIETAKGMRDSFAQEAAGQARELGKTKASHCGTVIKTAMGAQNGVTTGAAQAIKGIWQLLGQSVEQARGERDSRTRTIATQLRGQHALLSKQQRDQRQSARDTALVQLLAVQLTAQQMTGDLLGAAAQALRGVGDGIAQAREQVEAGAPQSIEAAQLIVRGIRGRVAAALNSIRERLGNGLARAVTSVGGHDETSRTQIDRQADSARDAALQMTAGFSQAMSTAIADAIKSFSGQRAQFAGHMATVTSGISHAFECAVKSVALSYERQNKSITDGNTKHVKALAGSFAQQITGEGQTAGPERTRGLANSIKYYACVAARHERPAWEEVLKIILIIVVALIVSALLGPVVGAMVAGVGLAGVAATIVTAIIVGAIAGAVSSVAGQLFDNAMSGRRLGYGVKAAAKTGAISGAIGGLFSGIGGAFIKAAGAAGASVLTKFAIQFATDMATEYATQVATNLMAGKSLGESMKDINASGFVMAGAMSAGMFLLHHVQLPGSKKPLAELPPGRDFEKLPPALERAGARIKAVETAIAESKPVRAITKLAGAASAAVGRLGPAFKNTRVGAALEASGALGALGRGGRSLLNLTGRLQDLNTGLGERTNKLGEALKTRLTGAKPAAAAPVAAKASSPTEVPTTPHQAPATPHEVFTAPHEPTTTPHEPTATPHEPIAAPHEPTAAPHEPEAPRGPLSPSERSTLERTRQREDLTPEEARVERRAADETERRPSREPPFRETGESNGHRFGETPEGTFCRFSSIKCYDASGREVPPPEGARPPATDRTPELRGADTPDAQLRASAVAQQRLMRDLRGVANEVAVARERAGAEGPELSRPEQLIADALNPPGTIRRMNRIGAERTPVEEQATGPRNLIIDPRDRPGLPRGPSYRAMVERAQRIARRLGMTQPDMAAVLFEYLTNLTRPGELRGPRAAQARDLAFHAEFSRLVLTSENLRALPTPEFPHGGTTIPDAVRVLRIAANQPGNTAALRLLLDIFPAAGRASSAPAIAGGSRAMPQAVAESYGRVPRENAASRGAERVRGQYDRIMGLERAQELPLSREPTESFLADAIYRDMVNTLRIGQ